jgi:hypothetical protein
VRMRTRSSFVWMPANESSYEIHFSSTWILLTSGSKAHTSRSLSHEVNPHAATKANRINFLIENKVLRWQKSRKELIRQLQMTFFIVSPHSRGEAGEWLLPFPMTCLRTAQALAPRSGRRFGMRMVCCVVYKSNSLDFPLSAMPRNTIFPM